MQTVHQQRCELLYLNNIYVLSHSHLNSQMDATANRSNFEFNISSEDQVNNLTLPAEPQLLPNTSLNVCFYILLIGWLDFSLYCLCCDSTFYKNMYRNLLNLWHFSVFTVPTGLSHSLKALKSLNFDSSFYPFPFFFLTILQPYCTAA